MTAPYVAVPAPLSDPATTSVLGNAARWIEQVLLGTTATLVAVLAVATIGFLALTGRVELRRGAVTIVGCFILFGAPSIAAALLRLADRVGGRQLPSAPVVVAPPPPLPTPSPTVYDPYAGAAVNRR